MESALVGLLARHMPGVDRIASLRRLSGGASQETWSFDALAGGREIPLILRRRPGGMTPGDESMALGLETEAALLGLAAGAGVPVPEVRCVLEPGDGLGSGYVMTRLEGETIPRRILRDAAYDAVRPRLARQCGAILARIHGIGGGASGVPDPTPPERPIASGSVLEEVPLAPARVQLQQYRNLYDGYDQPHPVFDLAFRWLADRADEAPRVSLVHGDFRNGNLMIGSDGVCGVLDWELAHRGDPMEDLGWICVNSWRFGEIDRPVGGFGDRDELFAGYEEAGGGTVDPERVRCWETLGTLKWGIMCLMMYAIFHSGADRSVERAAIGRRASETEIDLLGLIGG